MQFLCCAQDDNFGMIEGAERHVETQILQLRSVINFGTTTRRGILFRPTVVSIRTGW